MHRVYFSLDYRRDRHRVGQVHGVPEVISRSAGGFQTSSVWMEARRRGDASIQGLINDALVRTAVTVVCIGFNTVDRKYLGYELERSLEQGNGLVGIKINHLPDQNGVVDKEAHAPPLIEDAGYNVYPYSDAKALAAHIEEAYELAKLEPSERLARKRAALDAAAEAERPRAPIAAAVDGTVELDGASYPLKTCNSRGFVAASYDGGRKEGDKVAISFSAAVADERVEFACDAKVLGVDATQGELVGVFVGMDRDTRATLARHFKPQSGAS
jgi:hypothetical protein